VRPRLLFLKRSEDGQAVVELALAIPVLLIVVLGIVDFGRAVNYWNDENQLAEQGARFAAVGSLPASDPTCGSQTTVASYLTCEANIDSPELKNGSGSSFGVHAYPNDTSGGVSVCVSVPNNAPGQEVTVKVTADYNWLPVPKVLGGSATFTTVPLAGSASMRIEASLPSSWITTTAACT